MVRMLGPDRVMFGGDLPTNVAVELTKYRTLDLTEEERQWCLWRTAREVFDLPVPE
jgi:predicted TIM-barrel fold metal-dependent hydrolase